MVKSKNAPSIISFVAFCLASTFLVFAVANMILYFFSAIPPSWGLLPNTCSSTEYTLRSDAISSVFTILGLVNFTYPYIVSTRNTRLYGIRLSRVMYSEMWWHGYAYIVYAVLIILGLYYGKSKYLFGAYVCLAGVFFAFISTGIVAIIFVFRQRNAIYLVEQYLTTSTPIKKARNKCLNKKNKDGKRKATTRSVKEQKAKKEQNERILQIGEYVHEYYSATQTVPTEVVKGLLRFVKNMPFLSPEINEQTKNKLNYILYSYSAEKTSATKKNTVEKAVETIYFVRSICERMFSSFDRSTQAVLLRRMLFALAEGFPAELDEQPCLPSEVPKEIGIMLCGIAAYLRTIIESTSDTEKWLNSWDKLFDQLLSASVYSPADNPSGDLGDRFRIVLQLLVLLIEASALVNLTATKLSKSVYEGQFIKLLIDISGRFDIGLSSVETFFSWGQAIVLASSDPDYDPERSCLRSYSLLKWINMLGSETAIRKE